MTCHPARAPLHHLSYLLAFFAASDDTVNDLLVRTIRIYSGCSEGRCLHNYNITGNEPLGDVLFEHCTKQGPLVIQYLDSFVLPPCHALKNKTSIHGWASHSSSFTMSDVDSEVDSPSLTASRSNIPTRKPQPAFTKEQKKFLVTFLPSFFALDGSKKGTKRDYVESTPFVEFKEKYNSEGQDGPNLEDLLEVCTSFSPCSLKTSMFSHRKCIVGSLTRNRSMPLPYPCRNLTQPL
jgi:hypothetical protein